MYFYVMYIPMLQGFGVFVVLGVDSVPASDHFDFKSFLYKKPFDQPLRNRDP